MSIFDKLIVEDGNKKCRPQLCNSVTLLLNPDEIKVESWETRKDSGLRVNEHYLAVSADPAKICDSIAEKVCKCVCMYVRMHVCMCVHFPSLSYHTIICVEVSWVMENPVAAEKIAENGRRFALGTMPLTRYKLPVYRTSLSCQHLLVSRHRPTSSPHSCFIHSVYRAIKPRKSSR